MKPWREGCHRAFVKTFFELVNEQIDHLVKHLFFVVLACPRVLVGVGPTLSASDLERSSNVVCLRECGCSRPYLVRTTLRLKAVFTLRIF